MTAMQSVDGDRIRRIVTYTDLPATIVGANDPDALLEGGAGRSSGGCPRTVQGQLSIALDGHPGREVRFWVCAASRRRRRIRAGWRIFLWRNRLYQAITGLGLASKVTEEELDHFVKSFELLQKVLSIASTMPAPRATPRPSRAPARPRRRRNPGGPPPPPRRPSRRHDPPDPQAAPPPARAPRPCVESQPDPATGSDAAAGPGPRRGSGRARRATTGRIS